MNDKIQRTHLERMAVVYLRQSTMRQVHEHRESTARQYNLQQRAIDLGWTPESVQVVDEDLGQSGSSTENRTGFRQLAEDVARCRVGAIFALEPSRFARNSADWHRLLELCGLANVLIADEQGVYAPRDPNDRLLLGLKGQMSEAEQYWMRLRLYGGKLAKARRGDLYIQPPTGYEWDEGSNRLRLDPDEEVRHAVRLVFERFGIDGSSMAVMRYFARNGLRLPARASATGEIQWMPPRATPILNMLKNPLYTGTYVYGRREERVGLVNGERRRRRITQIPRDAWKACLRDHHPAYISWEQFTMNQEKLNANRTNHKSPDQRGAAREGAALLQGLVLCGRCGNRMTVHYTRKDGVPNYVCHLAKKRGQSGCWTVPGERADQAVAEAFLSAAQPPEIELSFAVAREADRQAEEIDRQWKLRLDRVRYETQIAERRYKAVDPDNRVVARTLERDWEEKLREAERVEREHVEVRQREKVDLTDDDRAQILALARDLPRVWRASTTTPAQRKNLLRMLVREVSLTPIDVPIRQTRIQILWVTGAVTAIAVDRPTRAMATATSESAVARIRELVAAGRTTRQIATALNRAGMTTGKGNRWNDAAVQLVRRNNGLQSPAPNVAVPNQRDDGLLSTNGVAARFGVTPHIVRYWVERGLLAPKAGGGQGRVAWYEIDDDTTTRLEAAKAAGYGPRPHSRDSQTNPR